VWCPGTVTGDAPQPGDKPRNEKDPWAYPESNTAWWRVEQERDEAEAMADAVAGRPRHPRRRPAETTPADPPNDAPEPVTGAPAFAAEAFDAHAAGVQDVSAQLNPPPAALVEAEQEARIEGYEMSTADETPDQPDLEQRPDPVPEVMVLPEPVRNRPTVALDRGPVPDQPSAGTSRLSEASRARLESSRERLENSPFWQSEEERAATGAARPEPDIRERLAEPGRGRPPAERARSPRRPLPGLIALVALALVAAFFSWVSAEPFWLAVGHGDHGVATIARCTGDGVTQRCTGSFAAGDDSFTVQRVALLGVGPEFRDAGAVAPARMVSPDSRQAYVGDTGWMVHLRWVLGFILVLMCGYGIAGMTGARQLETASARRGAVLISVAGPVLLLLGFLAAAY
jgi:hypothetical protein